MIKLQAIGRIGKDCTVNNVNGKQVINFIVAHSEKYKDHQGNQQEKTTWIDCAYWTDRTAIAPYLTKGAQVYVEGQPEAKMYTGKDGSNGSKLSVRVFSVELLSSNKPQQQPAQQNQPAGSTWASDDENGSLPF